MRKALALALMALSTGCGSADPGASAATSGGRFDSAAAFELLREQVELGPRPAGSAASRRLARRLRRLLPDGEFQRVPGGLRNVLGATPGRRSLEPVIVGAHYDTKDIPGFVGANDGASGTAVVVELARTIEPRELRRPILWMLFDGEESPRGVPDSRFTETGLRGSRVAARELRGKARRARALVLLDFVGDRDLSIPREAASDPRLWKRLRRAARSVGHSDVFPSGSRGAIADDHYPFIERGIPSIDLIDFDFPCWHRTCDDLSAVSRSSLEAVGESVYELLRRL